MVTKRRLIIGGGLLAVVAMIAFGGGVWCTTVRDDAPERVSLADAVAGVQGSPQPAATSAPPSGTSTVAPSSAPSAAPSAAPASTPTAAPSATPASSLAGAWMLAAGSDSFVGYRVREELARIGSTTAVGRTRRITATLQFDGTAITELRVTADLTALQSDSGLRDRALRDQALETASYPSASFALTRPIVLDRVPAEGVPLRATVAGDLTLHGVTRPVTIDLEGQLANGLVVVVGSLDIRFADFNIAQPRAASVLSVEDHGLLELQLVFQRQSGQG